MKSVCFLPFITDVTLSIHYLVITEVQFVIRKKCCNFWKI